MTFLRRISTRRLLSICALALVIVIGGTAVALATTAGDGPKPPAKPLANAVHDALEAPTVPGISADIHFTNNLVDASSLEGKDPILAGATGRFWASPAEGGKLRLELQAEEGGNDSQVLVEGHHFEIYDGTSETVYEGTLPEGEGGEATGEEGEVPSVERIQQEIERLGMHVDLSGAIPSDVAGQPTYTVRAAPSHDGGLLGRVELAWDAANGIPLRAAVYSSESSSPVLELEATGVSFEAVPASVFEISPPAEAEVVNLSTEGTKGADGKPTGAVGEAAVKAAIDFPLAAPPSLAGLPQAEVRAIEFDGHAAALVTYGKGLGGIAVIESKSSPEGEGEAPIGGGGIGLPKVAIGSVKGEELDTALGSVLRFSSEGVDYVVLGSVPPVAVEAAARGL